MEVDSTVKRRTFLQRAFFGGNTRNTMIRTAALIVVCAVVFGFILRPIRIEGISMSPTYSDQSLNLVNVLAYKISEPQRGDVVSISGLGVKETYMKRIVVLPGETFSINAGYVFINGKPLDEPYVKFREKWFITPRTLGPDEYFVIGDNRGMAQHAHKFGRVERKHILGKVVF